jgi:hypothetical protein
VDDELAVFLIPADCGAPGPLVVAARKLVDAASRWGSGIAGHSKSTEQVDGAAGLMKAAE